MEFEVCIDSVETAIIAGELGATRVELCSALSEGGLTPSIGMIQACATQSVAEVFVMIRPRAGGFDYSEEEIHLMREDIQVAAKAGAKGVVFGVLDKDLNIHVKHNLFLIEEAMKQGLGTTFHRAIDLCPNPTKALEDLINMGFDRILTSGTHPKALQGIHRITEWVEQSENRIAIMAGSGINPENTSEFQQVSGLHAIHFTARKPIHEKLSLDMGQHYETDLFKIEQIAKQLNP